MSLDHSPFLLVVSAPSGCGKTTILRQLLVQDKNLAFSVSTTSRPPRPDEVEGRDYFFVSKKRFEDGIESGEFLEYAMVHGNYYGTARTRVREMLSAGKDVILDIDVQGAMQLDKLWPDDLASVFILPPSLAELRRRLVSRGTEDAETVRRRLANARGELKQAHHYRYLLINDLLDDAVSGFRQIISAERKKSRRNQNFLTGLLAEFGD